MIHKIRDRLHAIEKANKLTYIPLSVIIFWDENKQSWIAKELYVGQTSTGKVKSRTAKEKLILLNSPESYEPPNGFKGTIINEGMFEE